MEKVLNDLFKIVDNDRRLALTQTARYKIKTLVNEKIIFKEELLNIINETPNDMELGFKIRNLFNRV
jgi:hypothetical protein